MSPDPSTDIVKHINPVMRDVLICNYQEIPSPKNDATIVLGLFRRGVASILGHA